MSRFSLASLVVVLILLANVPALAATRIVTLKVPGMTCPSCPVTLRTVLDRIHGVHVQTADLKRRTLTVSVTDDRVSNSELTTTTAAAGFASFVLTKGSQ